MKALVLEIIFSAALLLSPTDVTAQIRCACTNVARCRIDYEVNIAAIYPVKPLYADIQELARCVQLRMCRVILAFA